MQRAPILLVEDDRNDADLFRLAIKRAGISNPLTLVSDGEQAIKYLEGKGEFAARDQFPLPCLLVTDLKMPRCSGFDLLGWLQQQNGAFQFPSLVLSGSPDEEDRNKAAALGARDYLVKPSDLRAFAALAARIKEKWLL